MAKRSPRIVSSRTGLAAVLLLATLVGAQSAPAPSTAAETSQQQLETLIDEVLEWRRQDNFLPVPTATDARYSKRLGAVGSPGFEAQRERLEEYRERLDHIDRGALPEAAAIDAEVLAIQLTNRINELRHHGYLLPVGSRSGFHFGFANRAERSYTTVTEYDDYVAKLQSFLQHTRQQIVLMREGIAAGWVMPEAVMEGYDKTAAIHIAASATESAFYTPLAAMPDTFTTADRARLLADGEAAIADSVLPAYRELARFFADEYIPAARPTLGVTALPGGAAYYRHRVAMYTTLDLSAQQIHTIGIDKVAELRAAMDGVRAQVGFAGDHMAFVEFLRTDPRFYVDTTERYLEATAYASKLMEGHLPELFGALPRTPFGIRAMPAHIAPRQSAGYYDRGKADGTEAGWVNINTSQLYSRPLYVSRALAYHEGVPGHHLQIMLALENEEISEFRRSSGVTVFVEGWGLYAERLGTEAGLYDDPYDRFGMLSYQIWRACRLVVDTGMHALGWSRERAIEYMADNTGMGLEPVAAEIDRHITEPGQGLAYTLGELEITRLRAAAEERLGSSFDVRQFHDAVLRNGAIPLSILRRQIEAWTQEREANR